MNTSLNWIKAMVPGLEVTDQEFRDAMTLSGTKVENFTAFDKNLDKIVVGQIESVEKHPDADKLVICQVNVGSETVQIVTGAPNIPVGSSGQKVPVVLDGGRVAGGHDGKKTPGGIEIKKGKLRGIDSYGMMCSIEELGSDRNMYPEAPEYGIYIFNKDVKPGDDAVEALGLRDAVVEFEITSNRVDCYSIIGIAREAAATFRKPFTPPVVSSVRSPYVYCGIASAFASSIKRCLTSASSYILSTSPPERAPLYMVRSSMVPQRYGSPLRE